MYNTRNPSADSPFVAHGVQTIGPIFPPLSEHSRDGESRLTAVVVALSCSRRSVPPDLGLHSLYNTIPSSARSSPQPCSTLQLLRPSPSSSTMNNPYNDPRIYAWLSKTVDPSKFGQTRRPSPVSELQTANTGPAQLLPDFQVIKRFYHISDGTCKHVTHLNAKEIGLEMLNPAPAAPKWVGFRDLFRPDELSPSALQRKPFPFAALQQTYKIVWSGVPSHRKGTIVRHQPAERGRTVSRSSSAASGTATLVQAPSVHDRSGSPCGWTRHDIAKVWHRDSSISVAKQTRLSGTCVSLMPPVNDKIRLWELECPPELQSKALGPSPVPFTTICDLYEVLLYDAPRNKKKGMIRKRKLSPRTSERQDSGQMGGSVQGGQRSSRSSNHTRSHIQEGEAHPLHWLKSLVDPAQIASAPRSTTIPARRASSGSPEPQAAMSSVPGRQSSASRRAPQQAATIFIVTDVREIPPVGSERAAVPSLSSLSIHLKSSGSSPQVIVGDIGNLPGLLLSLGQGLAWRNYYCSARSAREELVGTRIERKGPSKPTSRSTSPSTQTGVIYEWRWEGRQKSEEWSAARPADKVAKVIRASQALQVVTGTTNDFIMAPARYQKRQTNS